MGPVQAISKALTSNFKELGKVFTKSYWVAPEIDLTNYSYKEVINILKLMNVNYTIEGKGYVYEQSIQPGQLINNQVINIKLKEKY